MEHKEKPHSGKEGGREKGSKFLPPLTTSEALSIEVPLVFLVSIILVILMQ
jgi:hypothetical protein